jgi:hypothetical protein
MLWSVALERSGCDRKYSSDGRSERLMSRTPSVETRRRTVGWKTGL